jgi:hypothetical protein
VSSDPLLFRPPVLKTVGNLAGCLAFVGVGALISLSPGRWVIGIPCAGLFGCGAAAAASRLIRRPVMLTISLDAIEDHRGRRIRFEDVDHVVLTRVSHARFLVIMAREGTPSAAELRAGRTRRMNEAFLPGGSRGMWIPSASVAVPLDELGERLSAMIPCQMVRLA